MAICAYASSYCNLKPLLRLRVVSQQHTNTAYQCHPLHCTVLVLLTHTGREPSSPPTSESHNRSGNGSNRMRTGSLNSSQTSSFHGSSHSSSSSGSSGGGSDYYARKNNKAASGRKGNGKKKAVGTSGSSKKPGTGKGGGNRTGSRFRFTPEQNEVMRAWLEDNLHNPYPE
jgi:hypothetical protein